jgi:hypothetical protein
VLAFSPMLRAVPVRCDVTSQPRWSVMPAGLSDFLVCSSVVADHREAVAAAGFCCLAFPLNRKGCSERPGAVQGAPLGAAQRILDGEDRSEMMDREGKPCVDCKRFLKREQAGWDALNVCQPWFYLRLVAYGFFRLSEGA